MPGQHYAPGYSSASSDSFDGDRIAAPGLAALLRRHPGKVRATASGAIVSGFVLFVIASLVTSAGADPAGHKSARAAAHGSALGPLDVYGNAPAGGGTVQDVTKSKPVHATNPAPATKAVISGLAANGIPNVALNAYRVAAARVNHADPGCGIDWALLAGIGREESDHGRFGGAVLHANGVSTPHIIGIPLDGSGTALIRDTDGGRLDGDTVYDHAVGPMQFIPSTWAGYGVDANGDGTADVFNINDAALGAARYLCAAGGNLRTHEGQVAAVLAYNHSDEYLAQVLALADAYRRGIPVSGLPVGNTSGSLPPIKHTSTPPPVNPAAPTANAPASSTTQTPTASKPTSSTGAGGSADGSSTGGGGTSSGGTSTGGPTGATTSGGTGGGGTGGGGTGGGGTVTTPVPLPTTTAPVPSPSPTKTCVLWDLTHTKCVLYGL